VERSDFEESPSQFALIQDVRHVGFTKKAIAEHLGISKYKLERYESGCLKMTVGQYKEMLRLRDEGHLVEYRQTKYELVGNARIKINGQWIEGYVYRSIKTGQHFVREKEDFESKFKTIV